MRVPSISAYTAGSAPRVAAAPARLRGRALAAARIVLVAVAALALTILVVAVPARYHQLRTLAATGLGDSWTNEQARAALAAAGVPLAVHAASIVGLDIVFVAVFFAVAGVLVARRSDERIALFVAIFLIAFSVNWTTETAWWAGTLWYIPVKMLNLFSWISFTGFFFLFPDGRFAPGWMRPFALGWLATGVLIDTFVQLPQPVVLLLWLAGLGLCLFAQVYRFRRISGPIERQQPKWVVFGFAVPFALVLLLVLAGALVPAIERPGVPGLYYATAGRLLTYSSFVSLPLSLCVAILRYRLWDIDILINRALVYSALTLLIVALYVVIVGGLGALLQAQGNLLVSLVGAGLIAVLFQPLRAWLQRGVNRLMFGERDDPYAALSRLGRRLDATPGAPASPTMPNRPVLAYTALGYNPQRYTKEHEY